MASLYVTEVGSKLRFAENTFIVDKADGSSVKIPGEIVESIQIHGRTSFTAQCLEKCLKEGIPVVFFSSGGNYLGELYGEATGFCLYSKTE